MPSAGRRSSSRTSGTSTIGAYGWTSLSSPGPPLRWSGGRGSHRPGTPRRRRFRARCARPRTDLLMSTLAVSPRVRLARPVMGEEEVQAIRDVLHSGILTNGPRTAEFEQAFARRHQTAYGVAFANGTVALAGMYLACGIGPGDEVIVPSLTFISSATSVLHVGATPVFAEILPGTFDLDPDDVRSRITARTKAILVVHYGGQPAAMTELRAVAGEADVLLLEDAAEAHGAGYHGRPVGGLGAAAMFSFTPTKNLSLI